MIIADDEHVGHNGQDVHALIADEEQIGHNGQVVRGIKCSKIIGFG